jgi:hypothetical protein
LVNIKSTNTGSRELEIQELVGSTSAEIGRREREIDRERERDR